MNGSCEFGMYKYFIRLKKDVLAVSFVAMKKSDVHNDNTSQLLHDALLFSCAGICVSLEYRSSISISGLAIHNVRVACH